MMVSAPIQLFFTLFSAFTVCVESYRIFEYLGDQCNGAQVNVHRLAGPSPCTSLSVGVTQSVFVKIDNVHDDQYDVVLYSSESCDGQIVGLIHNTNGCLPVDVPGFGKAQSVRVIPTNSQTKMLRRADDELESAIEYNMDRLREGTIQSPISPGVFVTIKEEDHDDDGFFTNELAAEYNVPDPELAHVNSALLAYEGSAVVPLDLRYQYCRWMATCRSVFSPLANVDPSLWIDILGQRVGSNPWRSFREGASILIGAYNTGASTVTYYVSFMTSGTQQKECDTTYTSGAVVKDSLQAQLDAGKKFTDIVMDFCTHDQECFAFAAHLYTLHNMREGNCPDP